MALLRKRKNPAAKAEAQKEDAKKAAPAKKAPAKSAAKKVAPAKKAAAKKTAAKAPAKTTAKKAAAKTPAKAAPEKAAAKKAAPAKKAPAKKTAAKTPAKKTAAKAPAKKAAAKAPAKKAAPTKKAAAAKAPAKKTAAEAPAKAAPEKVAAKSTANKKAPNGNSGPRPLGQPKVERPAEPLRFGSPGYPFDQAFLDAQTKLLNEERETLVNQAAALKSEADALALEREPGDVQFDEESGRGDTLAVERDMDLARAASALQTVEEIDAALERIAKGVYGICEYSGLPIPKERLKAIPYARERVEFKTRSFR